MAKYTRDGTLYIKTWGSVKVPSDGAPYTIVAKAIPPYVAVNRYWIHGWMTGSDVMDHEDKQQIVLSAAMANFEINTGVDDATSVGAVDGSGSGLSDDQDHLNGFTGKHLPMSRTPAMYDSDGSDANDIDLMGTWVGKVSDWYRTREFCHYEAFMGLGKNAFVTSNSGIRYHAETVKAGRVNGAGCSIDEWRYLAIQAATDEITGSFLADDPEELIAGHATLDLDTLAKDVHLWFGQEGIGYDDNTTDRWSHSLEGMGLEPTEGGFQNDQLNKWMQMGWSADDDSESGLTTGSSIHTQVKLTLECKVLTPNKSRVFSPN